MITKKEVQDSVNELYGLEDDEYGDGIWGLFIHEDCYKPLTHNGLTFEIEYSDRDSDGDHDGWTTVFTVKRDNDIKYFAVYG